MSIIQMSLPIPSSSSRNLSSFRFSSDPENLNLFSKFSQLSLHKVVPNRGSTVIRMGGGPRTYPGGVSKWQWKRMQAKKQKQLLKARLLRERQIYEMRKRSELRAAVTELERPWEVVERAPTLFSVKADEQLKVLADRFHKPGGYDLWSEKDGPQVFHTVDGLPSTRFFPKGVVHSIRPYQSVRDSEELDSSGDSAELGLLGYDVENGNDREMVGGSSNGSRRTREPSNWVSKGWSDSEDEDDDGGFRSSSKKNTRTLVSRGGRMGDVKRLGSANGREVSKDFNGGRGGKGSSNVGLRRNETRQNVESRDFNGGMGGKGSRNGGLRRNVTRKNVESRDSNWLSSGKANFDRAERNEATFEGKGRYGNGRNGTRQSTEPRDSNLSPEKGNFDCRGRYDSNQPRQSTDSRYSNRLSSEKSNFSRDGRNVVRVKGRGRYGKMPHGSNRISNAKKESAKSRASKGREVYDMSWIGGESYEFQEAGQ